MKNKTRFLARVMLLVILVMNTLSLSSCSDPNCEKGEYLTTLSSNYEISLKVVSQTDMFSLDNISLDIYIGLQEFKKYSLINKSEKDSDDELKFDKELVDCYYIVALTTNEVLYSYDGVSDLYHYIYENMMIIKEISCNHISKFPFVRIPMRGTYIEYMQSVTVPENLIKNNVGDAGTIVLLFATARNGDKGYVVGDSDLIRVKLDYFIPSNNTIRLTFESKERW